VRHRVDGPGPLGESWTLRRSGSHRPHISRPSWIGPATDCTRLARVHSAASGQSNLFMWAARLAVAGPLLCITLIAVLHVLESEVNDSDEAASMRWVTSDG
jgi:hypothetical protein